jgi:hypothetical protein
MPSLSSLKSALQRFRHDEDGVVTVEFVIIFPIFLSLFLMTYESGIISLRHVMLERGVDVAARDVRIGAMAVPTADLMRTRICQVAGIIPDCENQLEVEMLRRNVRDWPSDPAGGPVRCIHRGGDAQPTVEFTNGGNNDLMFVRACARIDPMLPTSGIGKQKISLSAAIDDGNFGNAAAGSSYALVSSTAFVVEPFGNN